jgi:hypothetical protein
MLDKAEAELFVTEEINAIYTQLQQGLDVSIGKRLRLEGKIDLLLQLKLIDTAWLVIVVKQAYLRHFQCHLNALWCDWQRDIDYFCLPIKMTEAPVYKH